MQMEWFCFLKRCHTLTDNGPRWETYEHPRVRPVKAFREIGRPYVDLLCDAKIQVVTVGELSKLTMQILEHAPQHKLVREGDADKLKESEITQLMSWLGRDLIESSFALTLEEAIRITRTGDMENMYMRTRYVVESDPHYNKLLPEPSEQKRWEAIVKFCRLLKSVPEHGWIDA